MDVEEIKSKLDKWLRQAGGLITTLLQDDFTAEAKADETPVTAIDRAVERLLRSLITASYPEHGIIGEEFPPYKEGASLTWVIDPVDGTRALLGGFPTYTVMMVLLEQGRPVVSGILQPITKELWVGELNHETTMNGKPVRCRQEITRISDAHFATTSPHLVRSEDQPMLERLMKETKLCLLGGDGYAYGKLASGTVDCVVESGMQPYDFLPLIPIVTGAGGVITDWQGEKLGPESVGDVIAASSEALHAELLEKVRN